MTFESQIQTYFSQLEANPLDLSIVTQMERLYGVNQQWGEMISALHSQAESAGEPTYRARLLLESGRIAATRLEDEELAATLLNLAFESGQNTPVEYEAQFFALALQQQWDELRETFAKAVQEVTQPVSQGVLYERLGEILVQVGQEQQADSMFSHARKLNERSVNAMWAMQSLAKTQQSWERLAELVYAELEMSEDSSRQLELLLDLGDIYKNYLNRPDAAQQCYANVLSADPSNARAQDALRELGVAPEDSEPEEISAPSGIQGMSETEDDEAPVLEEVPQEGVETAVDLEPLSLDSTPVEEPPIAEAPTELVEASAPGIQEESSEVQEISEHFDPPETEDEAEPILSDGSPSGAQAILGEPMLDMASLTPPGTAREGTYEFREPTYEVAEIEVAPLHVEDEAASEVSEVEEELAPEPTWQQQVVGNLQVILSEESEEEQKKEALYTATLLEVLNRSAEVAPPQAELALGIWSTAFGAGLDEYLWDNFSYQYVDQGFGQKLLAMSQEKDASASMQSKIALFLMQDLDRAAELATSGEADDVLVMVEDARAIQEAGGGDALRKYQKTIEQRHSELDREARNVIVFDHMAKLAQITNDDKGLLDALRRLDRISDDLSIKGRLRRLYALEEKWPAYVDLLKKQAEALSDSMLDAKVALWLAAVGVFRNRIGNDLQAIAMYKQIAEAKPESMKTLDALIEIYASNNRASEQVSLLKQKVDIAKGRAQKVVLFKDVAQLYAKKLNNPGEALNMYEQVLALAPQDEEALTYLMSTYEKRNKYDKLIELRQRQLAGVEDPEAQLQGIKEIAALAAERVRNPDPAIDLWRQAQSRAPRDMEVLSALEALYEKKRDYEALSTILEQQVGLTEDASERMKIYQKLGMLLSERVQNPERAQLAWQGALAIDSTDLRARKFLERLYIDTEQWDQLEGLYAQQHAYSDLVRVFETMAGTNIPDETKIDLLVRSARIWRTRLNDLGRAERALERVQQINPNHEYAAYELAQIYAATGNWPGVIGAYEVILGHQRELDDRRQWQLRLAQVYSAKLNDQESAFSWLAQIFVDDSSRLEDADKIESLAGTIDAWISVMDLYEQALKGEGLDPELEVALRLRLGRVRGDEMEDLDSALEQYNTILKEHPNHPEAMSAMAGVYERQERWDELMALYKKRLELVEEDADRVVILHGLARIAEQQAGDLDRAVETYLEAYELAPKEDKTLIELHRLYKVQQKHQELAKTIGEEIALIEARAKVPAGEAVDVSSLVPMSSAQWDARGISAPSLVEVSQALEEESEEATSQNAFYQEDELERLVSLYAELGFLYSTQLQDDAQALDAFGKVVVARPSHREVVRAIEPYLGSEQGNLALGAALILEPVYEIHGRWVELIGALRIQFGALNEGETDQRAALLDRIATVHLDELGQAAESFQVYRDLLGVDPAHKRARMQLHRLADALGRWDEFVQLHQDIAASLGGNTPLQVEYLFTVARTYAQRLGRQQEAQKFYKQIIEVEPTSTDALSELEELYTDLEDWEQLVWTYEQRLSVTQDQEAARKLFFVISGVWERRLDEPAKAIATLEKALEKEPESAEVLEELERLNREQENWEAVAEQVSGRLAVAGDESQKQALKVRLGQVYEEQLDKVDQAISLYYEVFKQTDQQSEEAVNALERVMKNPAHDPATGPISDWLGELFTQTEQWERFTATLEAKARLESNQDRKIELLHQVAKLWEDKVGQPMEAMEVYSRAFAVDLERTESLDQITRLAQEHTAWDRVVQVLEQTAQQAESVDVKRDLWRRASRIYLDKLGDVEATAARLEDVLSVMPEDAETIQDLEHIYNQLGEWKKLVGVMLVKVKSIADGEEQKQLLKQAAMTLEEMANEPEEALGVYYQVLEVDPVDEDALSRIEALAMRLERWEELLENYQRKFDLATDEDAQVQLLYTMGSLERESLERPEDAIETYRKLVAMKPDATEALQRLDGLLLETENWSELLEVLERQRDLSRTDEEQKELRYRIGQIREKDNALEAIEVYRNVLAVDPLHEPTLTALAAMIERGDQEVEAAKVLRPIYEVSEQWEKLVHVLELLIASTEDVDAKLEIYKDMATIQERYIGDPASAFYSYSQALEVDPVRTEVLDELERLGRVLGAWDVYIDLLDAHMEKVDDPMDVAQMQLRVARVYEQELMDSGAAIDRYVRVTEGDPLDATALSALDRLYQQEQRWDELAEVLGTRVEQTLDPQERLELQIRQGLVYREFLSDRAQDALKVYESVLLEDPGNAQAIDALEEMFRQNQATDEIVPILEDFYTERGERAKLVDLYTQRLEFVEDKEARHKTFMLIEGLYEELGQPGDAIAALSRALVENPADSHTCDELERLAQEQGQWPLAAQAYFNVLETVELDDEWALAVYLRLARVIDEKMEMPLEAEDAYQRALTYDPGQPEALAALDRIYTQYENWEMLSETLERRLKETVDDELLIDLHLRAASVYREKLGDPGAAILHLQDLLKIDPAHLPALGQLEQLYMAQGSWEDLYEVLTAQVEITMDGAEQVRLYNQLAILAQEQLGKPEQAAQLLHRVIELEPTNLEAIRQLRQLYMAQSNWDELVQLLDDEIRLTDDPAAKLELYEQLGIILGDHQEDEVRALDAWLSALKIKPDHLPALEALRSIHAQRSDYDDLANILDKMLVHPDLASDRQRDLWVEQADLQGEFLSNPERAIEAWQNVAAIDPGSELALDSLERLYLEESRWSEAVEVLDAKLDRTPDQAKRLELAKQIAQILRDQVMDAPRAAQYYEFVLEIDPHDDSAYIALEEIYQSESSEEATNALVNLYIGHADVVQDDPAGRLDALRRAATVFEERAQQPQSALVVLLSALTPESLDDEVLVAQVETLAKQTTMWSEVLEHYRELLAIVDHDTDQYNLHRWSGRICAEEMGQLDDAVYHYQSALRIKAHSDEVLEKLDDLYQRLESWPELAKTIGLRLDVVDDPVAKIDLWRKLGEVYETNLDEPDNAIMAYGNLLKLDDTDLIALEAQERLFERMERWEDLVSALRQKIGATFDGQEQVNIRFRIAQIYEQFLDQIDNAIGVYHEIVDEDPSHLPTLESLERLYTNNQRWEEALDIYARQLNVIFEQDRQIDIYGKMAFIHEENFNNLEDAIDDYRQILTIDPANETAIQQLERLYYNVERWEELVEVAEQHIILTTEHTLQIQLLSELAKVHRDKREDPHSAIEVLERLLRIDPQHVESLRDLGALYEETGNLESAVDAYDRLAKVEVNSQEQIKIYAHIGELFERQIMDDSRAEHAYQSALNIEPDYPSVLESLLSIYERRQDWQAQIQVLKRADDVSKDLSVKASYMSRIGQIYEQRLGESVSALRYYEQAQEFDPNVTSAAEPLIDVYMREQRWERALPLLEKVLDRYQNEGTEHTPAEYHLRYLQMAQTCEQLGLEARAIENYHRAYEYDSSHLEGMLGLARALYRHEDFDTAFNVYQNIQLQHIERLSGDEAVEVFFNSGQIKQRLNDYIRATDYFEKTLDYDPTHKEATTALLENYERAEKWDRVIDLTRHLLGYEEDKNERFLKLLQIGDIYSKKMIDPGMAVQAYLEALDLEPQSVSLLRKLLDIYTKTRQWSDAVEILKQMISLEQNIKRKSAFNYTIGVIFREEIIQPLESIPYFEAALDQDPKMLKAFEAIDRILTEAKEWTLLEKAYRNMIHRVDEQYKNPEEDTKAITPLYVMLLQNLGEIYRTRLKKYKSAIGTFEMASNLAPDNEKLHLILAELYEKTGAGTSGVVVQHRKLIENKPFRIESYRALFGAFYQQGEYDKAWCMASALVFLQKANPDEQKLYQKGLVQGIQRTRVAFNLETFGMVYHPDQDRLTTQVMQLLYVALAGGLSRTHRDAGLNPKKPGLTVEDQLPFCNIFKYVSSRLGPVGLAPTPGLFLRRDQAFGLKNANVMPPALEVGADMLQGKADKELAFWTSKRLSWMMPEHYLGSLGYPTEVLKRFFFVALHLADPNVGFDRQVGADAGTLIQMIQDASRQSPALIMNLQKSAGQFLKSGRNADLSRWLTSAEHTSNRLGLLMCGDLNVAVECIKRDTAPIGKASLKDKIQELVLFSISDEYFALRQQLGFALVTKK